MRPLPDPGALRARALHRALHEFEQPVAALVAAGLTPEQAVDTYGAISVHIRGSVVLERLQKKTLAGRGIGFADDIDFDYILDSILDSAERELVVEKSTKIRA